MTSDNFDHELQSHLQSLSTDMTQARMPGPSAARTRAARRTRRQVTGSVLAGVAAVAVGTVIFFRPSLPAADEAPPAVPPSETETDTLTPTPSPTTDTGAPSIPESALMTPDDIWDFNDSDPQWNETDSADRLECFPDLSLTDAVEHAQVQFATERGTWDGMHAAHDLLLVEPEAASATYDELVQEIQECVPNNERGSGSQVVSPYLLAEGPVDNLGDAAHLVEYIVDYPDDPDASWFVEVGLARHGDLISIVSRWNVGLDKNQGGDYRTLAAATDRMCQAVDGDTCLSGEPAYDSGSSASSGQESETLVLADEPYLTDDDINPVGRYTGFSRTETTGGSATAYEDMCLGPFASWDAEVTAQPAIWHQQDGDGAVTEIIKQFGDASVANEVMWEFGTLPTTCGESAADDGHLVSEPADIEVEGADQATAWTVRTDPPEDSLGGSSSFKGIGVARTSNVIVVLTFAAIGDPTDGDWSEYAAPTLALALDRATSTE